MNKSKRCFVISPIGQEGSETRKHADDVFTCIVEPALQECGVVAIRADHMDDPGRITNQMIQAIFEYDLCIAILTGHNPNVFYELAVAQAARRPVILLIRKGEEIPFDVKDYRVVEYDLEPQALVKKTWVEDLVKQLRRVLSDDYVPPTLLEASNVKPRYKILFYSPTLKGNPFFHEILDHIIEITSTSRNDKKFDVIARKAVSTIDYHMTSDHLHVLEEYIGKDFENTVVIMIPANPSSYDDILNFDPTSKINLITLDMEVDINDVRLQQCTFLKQVILIDNKTGSELAAKAIIDYCTEKKVKNLNVMICEGEFHNRGKFFREALQQLESGSGIGIHFLDKLEKLSFSKPDTATKHVIQTLKPNLHTLQNRTTFIFCANDNLALGARIALSSSQLQLDSTIDIKIISFDASDVIRKLLELEDKYIFGSVDQKFYEYAQQAVRFAREILDGKTFSTKVTHIIPRMYKNRAID